VLSGAKSADDVFDDFADRLDIYGRLGGYDFHNNEMTYDEYMEYWDNISAIIKEDRVFEQFLRECFIN